MPLERHPLSAIAQPPVAMLRQDTCGFRRHIGEGEVVGRAIVSMFPRLVALVLLAAPAGAQGWTKYTNSADGFEVEISGATKVQPRKGASGGEIRETLYIQEGKDFSYNVLATLHKTPPDFESHARINFRVTICQQGVPETVVEFPAGRAVEKRGTACDGKNYRAIARFYAKENWTYFVVAFYNSASGDDGGALRFVRSFRVLQ